MTRLQTLRFLRYLLVGGLNTTFGLSVYSAGVFAGLPVWLALLMANVVGVLFNFITTGTIVFKNRLQGRLPRFIGAYLCIYLLNLALLQLLRLWIHGDILTQALLTLPMAAIAYLALGRFVFTDRPEAA